MFHSMLIPSKVIFLLVCPSVFSQLWNKIRCKNAIETELGMEEDYERDCGTDAKCGAIFCSTIDGRYKFNEWECYAINYGGQLCAETKASTIGQRRDRYHMPTGVAWQCSCQFGGVGENRANVHFVPPAFPLQATSKYQLNEWGAYVDSYSEQNCSEERARSADENHRSYTKQRLPNDATGPWKCTCQFGESGLNNTNEHFLAPTEIMKCKSALGTESGMIRDGERECFNDKCGAVFCSAENGRIQWNEWDCFDVSLKGRVCAKDKARVVGQERARYNLPSADRLWDCTCLFGEMCSNMTNAHFVPAECASIRHCIGMASIMVGLITGFLSFFLTNICIGLI
ncbi:hypothetical protein niasHT_028900 [Heterodera trifolii]|uniref:Uncharacterized protein n=1 Tax=Heterodera trifolii TaxID=157864 RepID=A0ABD2KC39_9BILA